MDINLDRLPIDPNLVTIEYIETKSRPVVHYDRSVLIERFDISKIQFLNHALESLTDPRFADRAKSFAEHIDDSDVELWSYDDLQFLSGTGGYLLLESDKYIIDMFIITVA